MAVAKPSYEQVSKQLILNGEFKAYQSVDLHAKISGYMKKLNVDAGDRVQAGQLIAQLEVPEMEADLVHASAERRRVESELPRARAELEKADANVELAKVAHNRLTAVSKTEPGLVAQQEIDEALARRRAAEAQVSSNRASIAVVERQIAASRTSEDRIKTMLAYANITAPFAGMITRRFADAGALIQAGTSSQTGPVVRLAEVSRLRLSVIAPEWAAPLIKTGQGVDIKVASLNKTFKGRISRSTGDVLQNSRTMELEADVPNPSGELAPGMYAEAILVVQASRKALTIPVESIGNSGGNRVAYVVNQANKIEERILKTGIEGASRVEIADGIAEGEQVVVSNRSLLRPGMLVEPRAASN
ncbi:MAG: efflux RND transporter periplasmic adaptor subunit [Candidatus Solibacter usitatus]|nr:efflux RND transporter periplasmic adaptor subunit [Candidatus Solibacter usitatus]